MSVSGSSSGAMSTTASSAAELSYLEIMKKYDLSETLVASVETVSGPSPQEGDIAPLFLEALPQCSVNILELSRAEREQLQYGPRVFIYVGPETRQHIAVLPLPALLAASGKHRQEVMVDPKVTLYKIHVPEYIDVELIHKVVTWFKEAMTISKPVGDKLEKTGNLKDDLLLCQAALSMGLDNWYVSDIFGPHWNRFDRLTGSDLTPETLEDIATVESVARDTKDMIFVHIANILATLESEGGINDLAAFEEFLGQHEMLRTAVEEVLEKLGDEPAWDDDE